MTFLKQNSLLDNLKKVNHICPNCAHDELSVFYEVRNVPVHSCLMLPSRQAALDFPCGDIVLGFCENCGFITNVAFDAEWSAYAPNYEDQQSFSSTFNKFAHDLAQQWVDRYDLHNKNIVEIGCSKGDFLLKICELGDNSGVGIDPSVVPGRVHSNAAERVSFIQAYYSEDHAEYVGDFICCRHTLEHIHQTEDFIKIVRKSIGDRLHTAVCLEIPDTTRVLKELSFEDIYYEHCSYFTPGSLSRLFRISGFETTDLYRVYGEQYLIIEALPVSEPSLKIHPLEESLEQSAHDVRYFASQIDQKLTQWKQQLIAMKTAGKRVVIWGSGSKCVAFLTTLDTKDYIEHVVDINPYRHGKFIPGVGKEIMPPEFLKDYQPDYVIVMNAIYRDEIQKTISEMDLSPEILTL